ncbi:MAG: IS1 family transposase [Runella sp.]
MCNTPERCPRCLSTNVKKNGFTDYLKPCNKCKDCRYKFVDKGQDWFISPDKKVYIKRLLAERISLRGICRVVDISMSWLLAFIKEIYAELPDDLQCKINFKKVKHNDQFYIKLADNEADELWSWVGKRNNVYYVWLVMHKDSKQIVAFHVGDRSRESAKALWGKIPPEIKENGLFHTDDWDSYKTVIPEERHLYCKQKKYTNHIERFNNTLRQRVSRLVRETLSFSKKLENHIGAIKYYLCYHNKNCAMGLLAP